MIKNLIAVIVVILINSCNLAHNGLVSKSPPKWYIEQQQNDQQFFYGAASGQAIEDAKLSALNELQSRISSNISSATQIIKEENSDYASSDFFQSIKQHIEKIQINNFVVDKAEQIDGNYFVQVKIGRQEFIDDLKQRLDYIQVRNDANYDQSQDNDIVNQKKTLEAIDARNQEAERINFILLNIDDNHDFAEVSDGIINYQQKLSEITKKIEIFLELENVPKNIEIALMKAVNKSGIKITEKINRQNDNLVIINIASKATHRIIYNSNISKIILTFKMISSKGKILATNQLEISGSSLINKEEAVNAAVAQFEDEISKKGILNIIGL